jgi:hypothetical protein
MSEPTNDEGLTETIIRGQEPEDPWTEELLDLIDAELAKS